MGRTKGALGKPKYITVSLEQLNKVYGPKAKIDISIKHAYHFAEQLDQFQGDLEANKGTALEFLLNTQKQLEIEKREREVKKTKIPFLVIDYSKDKIVT